MALNTNEFFIVSYLPTDVVSSILQEKLDQIDKYAYIFHDKDVYEEDDIDPNGVIIHNAGDFKPFHHHIYIKLSNYRKRDEVLHWFVNKKKWKENSFIEEVRSTVSVLKYLTHESDSCIESPKYVYSRDLVVSYNIDFNEYNYTCDTTMMIFQDLRAGLSIETLTMKYGREFVYHIRDFNYLMKASTGFDIETYQRMIMTPNTSSESPIITSVSKDLLERFNKKNNTNLTGEFKND